jgi:hypothetical protein
MVQEVIFLRKFLSNLGFLRQCQLLCLPTIRPALLGLRAPFNESVGGSDRAKHVDLRMHFVHEARAAGHLQLVKIES